MPLIAPEIVLQSTLKNVLDFLRVDYVQNIVDPTKSYLYRAMNNLAIKDYDYREQAIQLVMAKKNDARFLDVVFTYPRKTPKFPSIVVSMPQEIGGSNGLGLDRGYGNEEFITGTDTFREVYTRRYKGTYQITIASDNPLDVIVLYRLFKGLMPALIHHLNFSGLEDAKISGADLTSDSEKFPNTFRRAILITVEHEDTVEALTESEGFSSIIAEGIARDYGNFGINQTAKTEA